MNSVTSRLGRSIAAYLERPSGDYMPFSVTDQGMLCSTLQPGDVLLVEGNSRASKAIKYLTNSLGRMRHFLWANMKTAH